MVDKRQRGNKREEVREDDEEVDVGDEDGVDGDAVDVLLLMPMVLEWEWTRKGMPGEGVGGLRERNGK